jgi:hypothetical protein
MVRLSEARAQLPCKYLINYSTFLFRSSAELADGLLADDYEALEEDWEDPTLNFKAGKKKQKSQKMSVTSELDKDSVFQQGYV